MQLVKSQNYGMRVLQIICILWFTQSIFTSELEPNEQEMQFLVEEKVPLVILNTKILHVAELKREVSEQMEELIFNVEKIRTFLHIERILSVFREIISELWISSIIEKLN